MSANPDNTRPQLNGNRSSADERISGPETASARALLHTTKAWAEAQAEDERGRSLLYNLFRLRVVIAAVLLVAFSVLLTWRAPEELPAA